MAKRSGFRLLDGVIVAAVALLALKVLALVAAERGGAEEFDERPEIPAFARVLAHARTNYEPPDVTVTGSTGHGGGGEAGHGGGAAKPEPPPVETLPPPTPQVSSSERALLEKLGERRDELQQRAVETEQRAKLLEESEKRLDQRLDELKALQSKAEPAERKASENEAVGSLVVMYETMKPKEAAKIFDRLPPSVLLAVATQMKPKKMSEVLAAMSPAAAEKLTVALATRTKDGPSTPPSGLPAGELPAIEPAPQRR